MSEQPDHTAEADRLEHQADELEHRSERLDEEISDVREDWEAKKRDGSVPGAAGDPEAAEEDLPPEANYTSRGGEEN
jgi:hypothetical protein